MSLPTGRRGCGTCGWPDDETGSDKPTPPERGRVGTEVSVERSMLSRRNFLNLAVGTTAGATLAACGSSGPSSSGSGGGGGGAGAATYWFLTGQPQQAIREDTVKRFNQANPNSKITY